MSPKKMIGLSFAAAAAKLYEVFGQAETARTETRAGGGGDCNYAAVGMLGCSGALGCTGVLGCSGAAGSSLSAKVSCVS